MKRKYQKTLGKIFKRPTSGNIPWTDGESLFKVLGADVSERAGSRVSVVLFGEKHFLAIEDCVRESTQSWREVLLKLKSRGMNSPQLAVGDGAMGFWAALEEIYPATRQQHAQNLQCIECLSEVSTRQSERSVTGYLAG